MANKLPYMQFYVNDFDNDTKGVSSLSVGVWIRVLINMHKDGVGSITGTLDKLAKMTRCTVEELQIAIPELINNNIAEIANADAKKTLESQDCHALSHAIVTLTCRRMKREEEKRKLASIRKQKERILHNNNEACHADVTQKDSSLSRGNHAIRAPKESESESESESENTERYLSPKRNIAFGYETDGRISGIEEKQIQYWHESFPALDIVGEIRKAEAWLDSHRKNRKSDIKRFLVSWFTRSQDRAKTDHSSNELSIAEKIERGIPV